MEATYRRAFEEMQADLQTSLGYIFQDFAPGSYALSTNPCPYEGWQTVDGCLYHVKTQGVGVWEIGEGIPIRITDRPVETFVWKNACYEARVAPDGRVQVGVHRGCLAFLGALDVYEEHGDTYSEETGVLLGNLRPDGPMVVEQESDWHAVVCIPLSAAWGDIRVSAVVRLTFDPSPLIRWQIDLDSRGTDFRVEAVFETAQPGPVAAGMPFDVVLRPAGDQDLLPRRLEGDLAKILTGQREIGAVETFPFHDFVALSDGSRTAAVLAKGLHAYRAGEKGRFQVTLRRAVEWLAKPDLAGRVGDAGPRSYVPDARCERTVTHELAFACPGFGVDDVRFHALNAGYQNPPLLVQTQGTGSRTEWGFFQEALPLSSLQVANGRVLARIYNPTTSRQPLSRLTLQTDVFGHPEGMVQDVPAKGIRTLVAGEALLPPGLSPRLAVILTNPPAWRVGPNRGQPDPAVIQGLEDRVLELERQIEKAALRLTQATGAERYRCQHRVYVLERELYEHRLSIRLNRIKLENPAQAALDAPDEEVAEIGRRLNQLRIQRRIYDYIVQSL